jgi:DNA-binding NtrC family response regulator
MREAEEKIKSPHKHELESEALMVLCNYGWPGNVRELRHVVERLVATAMSRKITLEAVEMAMSSTTSVTANAQIPLLLYENDSLDAFLDRSFIALYQQLMAKTGNHSEAARLLGLSRTSLYQRLDRTRQRMLERGEFLELPKNGTSSSEAR